MYIICNFYFSDGKFFYPSNLVTKIALKKFDSLREIKETIYNLLKDNAKYNFYFDVFDIFNRITYRYIYNALTRQITNYKEITII